MDWRQSVVYRSQIVNNDLRCCYNQKRKIFTEFCESFFIKGDISG